MLGDFDPQRTPPRERNLHGSDDHPSISITSTRTIPAVSQATS
jgi:hypothetical protein